MLHLKAFLVYPGPGIVRQVVEQCSVVVVRCNGYQFYGGRCGFTVADRLNKLKNGPKSLKQVEQRLERPQQKKDKGSKQCVKVQITLSSPRWRCAKHLLPRMHKWDRIARYKLLTHDNLQFYQQDHVITWSGALHHSNTCDEGHGDEETAPQHLAPTTASPCSQGGTGANGPAIISSMMSKTAEGEGRR